MFFTRKQIVFHKETDCFSQGNIMFFTRKQKQTITTVSRSVAGIRNNERGKSGQHRVPHYLI